MNIKTLYFHSEIYYMKYWMSVSLRYIMGFFGAWLLTACSLESNIKKGLEEASVTPTTFPVTLSSPATNPHNSSTISITIDFADQVVTGLTDASFTVTGGAASNLVDTGLNGQGGSTFTMDITPSGVGNFNTAVQLLKEKVTNGTGEGNGASNKLTFNIDAAPPVISVTGPLTVVSDYVYTVTYSGASWIHLQDTDITLGGTAVADCQVQVTNGSSSVATVTVSQCSGAGTVNISIIADTAEDSVGNQAPAYGPSNDATVVRIPFPVTLSSAASSPRNASMILVTVDFGTEVVAGSADLLQLSDFTVTNGTLANLVDTGSGTEFTVELTPSGTGTTTIQLPKETVQNGTGNTNADSNTLSFTIDADAPTLAITGPVANGSDFVYTITYSGATNYLLDNTFIAFGGTATANCAANVTNGGTSVAEVTVSGCTGVGTVNISILAGSASDAVGNLAAAYGPSASATLAQPPFAVTLSSAASSPHNSSVISVTVDFGTEVVAGSADLLQLSDFTVTNGTLANLTDTGSGTQFTVDLTPSGTGTTTIQLPKETVKNLSGTQNADSNTLTFTIDADPPTLAVTGPVQTGGNIIYTVNYSGANTVNLQAGNITLGGTDTTGCGTPVVTNGTTSSATVTISGCNGDGTVNISIAAGTAQDVVLNQAAAYGPSADATVSNAFIMTIDTRNVSAASPDDKTVGLALENSWGYDFKVNWGDGVIEPYASGGGSGRVVSHTYATAGQYEVRIFDAADFTFFRFCYANDTVGDQLKLVDIKHWGSNRFYRMKFMFAKCTNVQISATDAPDLSRIIEDNSGANGLYGMFQDATNFNSNINHWDVSSIRTMEKLFHGASSFNQPLGNWNVSNVQLMPFMFADATQFNQDISSWNTSKVTDTYWMFQNAVNFNQPLATSGSSWDMSKVEDMNRMFEGATNFNQDISSWNTSNVLYMGGMFRDAVSFNQPLTKVGSSWDTSKVINMEAMFQRALSFNQDLSSWKNSLSAITVMTQMFNGAAAFDQDIHEWILPSGVTHSDFATSAPIDGTGKMPTFPP